MQEMTQIASAPFNEHYFKINGFNDLSSFVDQISAKSCDGESNVTLVIHQIFLKSFIKFYGDVISLPGKSNLTQLFAFHFFFF